MFGAMSDGARARLEPLRNELAEIDHQILILKESRAVNRVTHLTELPNSNIGYLDWAACMREMTLP